MLIVSLLFVVLICFAVPVAGMFVVRKKYQGKWGIFLAGALTFFVSQICLRIPLLQLALPRFAWYYALQLNVWYFGLFLGITAALFEEGGRWLVMRFLKRLGKLSPGLGNGLAFGLGHGGIEAALLVGLNALVILVMTVMRAGLSPLDAGIAFAGGVERLLTLAFHVGASLIVMYGIATGRQGRYLFLAFLLHALVDAAAVILPARFGVGILEMELGIAAFGGATLALGIILFAKKKRD